MSKSEFTPATNAVRTWLDDRKEARPLSIPITQAVNFQAATSRQLGDDFNRGSDLVYQRFGHPTTSAAAEKIALLEGAEAGLVFSSGMGAISTALITLTSQPGSHVVSQRQIFGQTFTMLDKLLPQYGVETTFVDPSDLSQVEAAIRPNTRFVYIESPSNPLIRVVDIAGAARIAKARGIPLLIDSTFASPYLQNPIALGATLVLHSGTKFLAGHSDLMAGAAAGPRELIARLKETQILLGSVLDPHAAWLLLRGIKTLAVRVQRQADSALAVARHLEKSTKVEAVHYPFLESAPTYRIARAQMRGGGGVLSFVLKGGIEAARRFVDSLRLIPIATSLGGVESVIEIPAELDWNEAKLGKAAADTGIPAGLIRLSIGIEDPGDLLADLDRGLAAA